MAGLPGSGKSTLAEIIGARMGATTVSVDPIEASILRAGIDSDQPTGLAAYLVAETMAEQVLLAGALGDRGCGERRGAGAAAMARPRRTVGREAARDRGRSVPTKSCTGAPGSEACRVVPTVYAVEQSVDEYAEWKGACASLPRVTIDTAAPIGENVEIALAFLER